MKNKVRETKWFNRPGPIYVRLGGFVPFYHFITPRPDFHIKKILKIKNKASRKFQKKKL